MAFLKFNKSELVNLEYSLKREIIAANESGAYCNTSIGVLTFGKKKSGEFS